jgi:two-component system sensor histidine kinase KdpD
MARGRLRIYLGASPGVGKTVAMLSEGARRVARGTDVVVALCETHARPHTTAMLAGLEVIPRRELTYRGATLTEMDLDAVLARRPQVALVDELAHTNAPGSRNHKRWQDIEEILAAGIDVISTVNIQHLESLNDAVEAITGIAQQETVPDHVVRAADQIELVDMSPEALRRRMAHGNIYKAEKIDAALSNYFRVGNLSALRELALLWLADRVDEGLERYREDNDITGTWPTRERVVVAVSGGPEGATLLRRGARIASRGAGGELHAVFVARSDGLAGPSLPSIAELRTLTEELGGTFHTVTGDDPATAVLDYARAVNASQVVIGSSRHGWWSQLLHRGSGAEIIAHAGDIDVHVVTHSYAGRSLRFRARRALPARRVLLGSALGVAGPAVLTPLLALLPQTPKLSLIIPVYLLLTVLVALVGGLWPAVGAAVVSSVLINWFFTPPLQTLTIADPENVFALVAFVGIASLVSSVVHRSARKAEEALEAQEESTALAELTHTLLGSTDQMALLLRRAVDMFGAEAAAVVRRATKSEPETIVAATDSFSSDLVLDDSAVREAADNAHDLVLTGASVAADHQRLFAAYAIHAGAILHRRALQQSANTAETLARDNRARTALLSAVSHDLRTPLASIKAAIGSLRSDEVSFDDDDEAELEAIIEESADRLETLIANLLDMSRLQAGALVARLRAVDLGESVPQAVAGLTAPDRVHVDIHADARLAWADAGLLERVLGNVLENALRHQPGSAPVTVTTVRIGRTLEIRVSDTGPGVPEADRERIFVPFQRLGDTPSGEGVGLGLAVARGLTEAMGGTLVAEDSIGGGLTLVVTLPVVTVVGAAREGSSA